MEARQLKFGEDNLEKNELWEFNFRMNNQMSDWRTRIGFESLETNEIFDYNWLDWLCIQISIEHLINEKLFVSISYESFMNCQTISLLKASMRSVNSFDQENKSLIFGVL